MREVLSVQPERPPLESATTMSSQIGFHYFSMTHFLAAMFLLLFALPFVDQLPQGDLIGTILASWVLLAAVMTVSQHRRIVIIAGILAIPAVIGKWAMHFRPSVPLGNLSDVAAIVFVAFVIFRMLRYIQRAQRVNNQVLGTGIATYLLIGILWSQVYALLDRQVPDSFAFHSGLYHSMAGFEGIYYSFGTLTTVGSGDITPLSNIARMLTVMEAMAGVLFLAILVARLVSDYSSNDSTNPPASSPDPILKPSP